MEFDVQGMVIQRLRDELSEQSIAREASSDYELRNVSLGSNHKYICAKCLLELEDSDLHFSL